MKTELKEKNHYDIAIDLTGLNCPLPILKTKAALAKMESGKVLKINVSHSDSIRELKIYAQQSNSHLIVLESDDDSYIVLFEKSRQRVSPK